MDARDLTTLSWNPHRIFLKYKTNLKTLNINSIPKHVATLHRRDFVKQNAANHKLLVCNWPHSVGQNHFFVKTLFNRDSAIQKCFQKILHSLQLRRFGSLLAIRTTCHTVRTPIYSKPQPSGRRVIPFESPSVQSIICPDDENFSSKPSPVSRSFELLQLAFV